MLSANFLSLSVVLTVTTLNASSCLLLMPSTSVKTVVYDVSQEESDLRVLCGEFHVCVRSYPHKASLWDDHLLVGCVNRVRILNPC